VEVIMVGIEVLVEVVARVVVKHSVMEIIALSPTWGESILPIWVRVPGQQ
jgi:hypothetical protein